MKKVYFFLLSHRTHHTITTLCSIQLPYGIMLICLQKKISTLLTPLFCLFDFLALQTFQGIKIWREIKSLCSYHSIVCFKCTQKTLVTDFFFFKSFKRLINKCKVKRLFIDTSSLLGFLFFFLSNYQKIEAKV